MSAVDEWVCPSPGCELSLDDHSLTLVLQHTQGLTSEQASGVADQVMGKLQEAFEVES